MNSSREAILGRVRAALAPLQTRAPLPDWDRELIRPSAHSEGWELFSERFTLAHGKALQEPARVAQLLLEGGWTRGYCDPLLWPDLAAHFPEPFVVDTEYARANALRFDFGITRASGAIAETGSLILSDAETSSRLAALAPWVHVAVLPRSRIYGTLTEALERQPRDPNLVWVTGPSKTGDIESILIKGIHGPGVQVALLTEN